MFSNNNTFYPTPSELIDKMLNKVDLNYIETILEPNAGKGDIVKVIDNKYKTLIRNYYDIDCIELDKRLQYILKGKGYKVVHDDFLTFNTYKHYDLIVMNPPFDNGDKHLLKAIDIQKNGGQIVCILNAETIRNPYSNTRKDLLIKLKKYNAEIEFIKNGFKNAERKTDVEIVLIYINIPDNSKDSIILDSLKQDEQYKIKNTYTDKVISSDFIDQIIQKYNFEAKAGVKLINEYMSLQPYLSKSFESKEPILRLSITGNRYEYIQSGKKELINKYLQELRYKYWKTLFQSDIFRQLLTTDLYSQYMKKLDELKNYDFSKYNIEQIEYDIKIGLSTSIEDTIVELFDEFTDYAWYPECKNNIHYYNGWTTNKAHKLNDKKTIIRLNAYSRWDNSFSPTDFVVIEKLQDIEKVFNYLDEGRTIIEHYNLRDILKQAERSGQTKKVNTKYFYISFYKKGTAHIYWKNKKLIKKLNIIAAQNKNWLPPSYNKKQYNDMTDKEKRVIDEFEGEKSYNNTIKNKRYYTLQKSKLLALKE